MAAIYLLVIVSCVKICEVYLIESESEIVGCILRPIHNTIRS